MARKDNERNSREWTREDAHEATVDLFPNITTAPIPREVLERLDLNPSCKLLYGALAAWRGWVYLRLYQVAGLVGMNPQQARINLRKLEKEGLILRNTRMRPNRAGQMASVTRYKVVPPPKRPRDKTPTPLKGPIKNINEKFKEYFSEIDLDS